MNAPDFAHGDVPDVTGHVLDLPTPRNLPQLPRLFRVMNVTARKSSKSRLEVTATLFEESAQLSVRWETSTLDPRIVSGRLVSPRWPVGQSHHAGPLSVTRLVPLCRPEADVNLFRTLPSGWVKDRALIRRAIELTDRLPTPYRQVFNAVMWDAERFRRFCRGPSSKQGHHSVETGNLMHTIDTAERIATETERFGRADVKLAILVALLHDAGKADEYRLGPDGFWVLTERGRLLGHRVTVIEWVAVALATIPSKLSEPQRMALMHCLTAMAHTPAWMGIRSPAMFEAMALSACDRLSGSADLLRQCAPRGDGTGRYHPHLGTKSYFVTSLS